MGYAGECLFLNRQSSFVGLTLPDAAASGHIDCGAWRGDHVWGGEWLLPVSVFTYIPRAWLVIDAMRSPWGQRLWNAAFLAEFPHVSRWGRGGRPLPPGRARWFRLLETIWRFMEVSVGHARVDRRTYRLGWSPHGGLLNAGAYRSRVGSFNPAQ